MLSVGSAAVGIAAGSLAVYLSRRSSNTESEPTKIAQADQVQTKTRSDSRTIEKDHLEKSRGELRTLLLEKELVSAALTRLYEAEVAREITREERETLSEKYRNELKSLESRISKLDALIQIGDLETLRNQLLQLVNQKIDSIDKRIESTKYLAAPLIDEILKNKPPKQEVEQLHKVPDISDMLEKEKQPEVEKLVEKPVEQPPVMSIQNSSTLVLPERRSTELKKSDDKVEELQKELLDALDRLEKLDVET